MDNQFTSEELEMLGTKGVYKKNYFVILEHAFLRNSKYTITEKMLYLNLLAYAGDKSSAFPSINSMAMDLNIGESTVKRSITTLIEKHGLLLVKRKYKDNNADTSNMYILADIDKNTGEFIPESLEQFKCLTLQPLLVARK